MDHHDWTSLQSGGSPSWSITTSKLGRERILSGLLACGFAGIGLDDRGCHPIHPVDPHHDVSDQRESRPHDAAT
jgi:hypothetical protein